MENQHHKKKTANILLGNHLKITYITNPFSISVPKGAHVTPPAGRSPEPLSAAQPRRLSDGRLVHLLLAVVQQGHLLRRTSGAMRRPVRAALSLKKIKRKQLRGGQGEVSGVLVLASIFFKCLRVFRPADLFSSCRAKKKTYSCAIHTP